MPPICQPEQRGCGCVDPGRAAGVHYSDYCSLGGVVVVVGGAVRLLRTSSRKRNTKPGHSIWSSRRQQCVVRVRAYALF